MENVRNFQVVDVEKSLELFVFLFSFLAFLSLQAKECYEENFNILKKIIVMF